MLSSLVQIVPTRSWRPTDIESALQKIDEIASYHEGVAAEEALILRGLVTGTNREPYEGLRCAL